MKVATSIAISSPAVSSAKWPPSTLLPVGLPVGVGLTCYLDFKRREALNSPELAIRITEWP